MAQTSLRWYDPDQVQRVNSQFFAKGKKHPESNFFSYYELTIGFKQAIVIIFRYLLSLFFPVGRLLNDRHLQ